MTEAILCCLPKFFIRILDQNWSSGDLNWLSDVTCRFAERKLNPVCLLKPILKLFLGSQSSELCIGLFEFGVRAVLGTVPMEGRCSRVPG